MNKEEMSSDFEHMSKWLELQPPEFQSDMQIVSRVDIGQDFFLRIDKVVPEVFYPNMPKSAMPSENTSVPRITCAPTLLGCMIGYFRIEHDIQEGSAPPHDGSAQKFYGGYKISKLPFLHAIKPSTNMVRDQASSDEHWLVGHRPEVSEIEPVPVGEFFLSELTYVPNSGNSPGVKFLLYVKVDSDDVVRIDNEHVLTKGHWWFRVEWPSLVNRSVKEKNLSGLTRVSEKEYSSQKASKAALLSYSVSPHVGW